MRQCTECGGDFMGRGRQKVCNICKGVGDGVQARVQETEEPKTKPERPMKRFGNGRFVFGNGAGVMLRR